MGILMITEYGWIRKHGKTHKMEITLIKQQSVNIKYKNGSVFDFSFRVTKDDDSAYDLTSDTLRMDIKENRNDNTYVYRLVSGTEITISDTNLVTFSKVMELPNDTYYYDLKITSDNYFIIGGLIKVERNVTT